MRLSERIEGSLLTTAVCIVLFSYYLMSVQLYMLAIIIIFAGEVGFAAYDYFSPVKKVENGNSVIETDRAGSSADQSVILED